MFGGMFSSFDKNKTKAQLKLGTHRVKLGAALSRSCRVSTSRPLREQHDRSALRPHFTPVGAGTRASKPNTLCRPLP